VIDIRIPQLPVFYYRKKPKIPFSILFCLLFVAGALHALIYSNDPQKLHIAYLTLAAIGLPILVLMGSFFSPRIEFTVTKDGLEIGKKKKIAWKEIVELKVITVTTRQRYHSSTSDYMTVLLRNPDVYGEQLNWFSKLCAPELLKKYGTPLLLSATQNADLHDIAAWMNRYLDQKRAFLRDSD
jgi:hypothetical protein